MILSLKKPVLSPLLKRELRDLRKEGIEPDPSEIVWLWSLCEEVARPNKRTASQVFNLPVIVAGGAVRLYHPAWAVRIWFSEVVVPFMPSFSIDFRVLCRAYVYAHGRDVTIIDRMATKADIERAVIEWGRGLNVTLEELQDGIDIIEGREGETENKEIEDDREVKAGTPWDYGELFAYLSHYYTVSVDEIRRLPDEVVYSMIDALPIMMQADNPMPGVQTNPVEDAAFWNLRQAVRIIRREHKEREGAANG